MLFIIVFLIVKIETLKLLFSLILFSAFIVRPTAKIAIICNYGLNVKTIVEKYCVNKFKPVLKCKGKCYLKKQLKFIRKETSSDSNNINFAEVFVPVYFNEVEEFVLQENDFYESVSLIQTKKDLIKELLSFEIEYPPELG